MSTQLHVIALISGGKDSLYSILHCLKNGHGVVALANLHPPLKPRPTDEDTGFLEAGLNDDLNGKRGRKGEDEGEDEGVVGEEEDDDLESYMYQTIGHSIVPLYQSALNIPLYRAPIRGTALNSSRDYQPPPATAVSSPPTTGSAGVQANAEDETESLYSLLQHVMNLHPTANAVSAGAILSTYQRTRIENVAGRLGLVPLAWLWMYPFLPPSVERMLLDPPSAAGLLEDMAACGCESRIIKVASGGLNEDLLWGDVAGRDGVVRRALIKAMRKFGGKGLEGAVLGEGGEYESLALDGPKTLWKRRIVVDGVEKRIREGGVSAVRIRGARCVDRVEEEQQGEGKGLELVRVPQEFDEEFRVALDGMLLRSRDCEDAERQLDDDPHSRDHRWDIEVVHRRGADVWTISNLCAPEAGSGAERQMEGIARRTEEILQSNTDNAPASTSTDDVVFATVLLRSMKDFTSINAIYASLFKRPNPPARVTVACGDGLPTNVDIMVSFILDMAPRDARHSLHVQSRSYWAPANIGPYSQAIATPLRCTERVDQHGGLVYVAGQIPLSPAQMEIPRISSISEDETWTKTFIWHTALSLQHLWRIGKAMEVDCWLGAVAFLSGTERIPLKVQLAWHLWEAMNRESQANGDGEDETSSNLDAWDIKYSCQEDVRYAGPNIQNIPNSEINLQGVSTPPFFAVQVDKLPRGSDIEWQGLGTRSDNVIMAEEDVDNVWTKYLEGSGFGEFSYIGIDSDRDVDIGVSMQKAMEAATGEHGGRGGDGHTHVVLYTAYPVPKGTWQGQIIPCKSVWGPKGRRLAAGITIHTRPNR